MSRMIESFRKNKTGITLMFVSSICVCTGQLLWKLSSTAGVLPLLGGFSLYGIGALIMLIAYKFGSLSVLQPMLAMNYVFTVLFAHYILAEEITVQKLIAICIIMFGVIMIGGGDD